MSLFVPQLCLQTEAAGLRAELSVCHERERMLNSDRDRLNRDVQDLLTQINCTTETNSQIVSTLNNQQVHITHSLPTLSLSMWNKKCSYLSVVDCVIVVRFVWQESLLAELQTSREELERFRESVSLTLSQLKTEKVSSVCPRINILKYCLFANLITLCNYFSRDNNSIINQILKW